MDVGLASASQEHNLAFFSFAVFYNGNYQPALYIQPDSPGALLWSLCLIYSENVFVYNLSWCQTQEMKRNFWETFGWKLAPRTASEDRC